MKICVLLLVVATAFASGQRITTIQLDGVQYFISRMNPYSPELNYFLAYQYCRSLGLQLASFETKEKADTMTQYLKNAGYKEYDFWTSGNKLGTDLYLWMSTGLPFNSTFDYMFRRSGNRAADVPPGTEPQRVARESDSGSSNACVAMMAPTLAWDAHDCLHVKDFICEQTRCYYYNYGSIPVSATQGNRRPYLTTTASPTNDIDEQTETDQTNKEITSENAAIAESGTAEVESANAGEEETSVHEAVSDDNDLIDDETGTGTSTNENNDGISVDPVVGRLIAGAAVQLGAEKPIDEVRTSEENEEIGDETMIETAESTRPDNIPDITSLFADGPIPKSRKETAFDGLVTHEVRSSSRSSNSRGKLEHRGSTDHHDDREVEETGVSGVATDSTDSPIEESHTIGPYDSVQDDYVNDHPDVPSTRSKRGSPVSGHSEKMKIDKEQDEDTSTYLPVAEPDYRYNIKWRSMGKVLEPPSK